MTLPRNDGQLTGEAIKAIRQRYGLSQQEFGARLGVTHAHISKIESGKENPSETLLKLIKYEFKIDKLLEVDSAEVTKPKIKQYLKMLEDLLLNQENSDGSLYNSEVMLAALTSIYLSTCETEIYRELLLESLSGIIDEIAQFIESTQNGCTNQDAVLLKESKFSQLKREIDGCVEDLYTLLGERVK